MKKKPKYPIIAVRVKEYQYNHVKREAERMGVTIAHYVRGILVPFNVSAR